MNHRIAALALVVLIAVSTGCASSSGGEKKKVDKPIADTYVPLKGAELNHRYSRELEELRAWQDAKSVSEAEYEQEPGTITESRSVPASRIQDPQPVAAQSSGSDAQIQEDENSLRISD